MPSKPEQYGRGAVTRTESVVFDESGVSIVERSNALGHKTWFYYQPRTRWLYGVADQNGPADKLDLLVTHDGIGRVREKAWGDGALEAILYGVGVERHAVLDGGSSATFFDTRGRPMLETWSAYSGSAVAENTYDSLGHVVRVRYNTSSQIHGGLAASEATARAGLGASPIQRRAASYDALGRLRTSTNGTNEVSRVDFPSPLGTTKYTDAAGNVEQTFAGFDGKVRVLSQTLVDSAGSRDLVTSYGYDDRGLLGHVKAADGRAPGRGGRPVPRARPVRRRSTGSRRRRRRGREPLRRVRAPG